MSKLKALFGFGFCFIAVACGGSGSADGDQADANGGLSAAVDFCDALCGKQHDCSKSVDLQTCTNDCEDELGASVSKLRSDYVRSISSCYRAEDCATVLKSGAVAACVDQANALLAPTETGQAFCANYSAAEEKCGQTLDRAACYDATKGISDATLRDALKCLSKSCADMDPCVSATF